MAVVVVFFITAAQNAAANMISAVMRNSLSPAARCKRRPTRSITPVFASPPVKMKRPAIVMTMSLPNPAKASVTVSVLVRTSAITSRTDTTSIGIRSRLKRTRATISSARTIAICVVTKIVSHKKAQKHKMSLCVLFVPFCGSSLFSD